MSEAIEPINWAENDSDSGYNEEQMSTASVTSSIFAYETENGRTYHAYKSGKYVMPNDEGEQERMDSKYFAHLDLSLLTSPPVTYHSLRLTLENKHFIAPIEEPRSIIDVGTGTGIWAMDVADDLPGSVGLSSPRSIRGFNLLLMGIPLLCILIVSRIFTTMKLSPGANNEILALTDTC